MGSIVYWHHLSKAIVVNFEKMTSSHNNLGQDPQCRDETSSTAVTVVQMFFLICATFYAALSISLSQGTLGQPVYWEYCTSPLTRLRIPAITPLNQAHEVA